MRITTPNVSQCHVIPKCNTVELFWDARLAPGPIFGLYGGAVIVYVKLIRYRCEVP
jgi:hypothetical protein